MLPVHRCLNEERQAWSTSLAKNRRKLLTTNEDKLESHRHCCSYSIYITLLTYAACLL